MNMIDRVTGARKPEACLGHSCSIRSGSTFAMCREATRDQAAKVDWGHTVEILNAIQRIAFNSVGSGKPLKENVAGGAFSQLFYFVSVKERL